MVELRKGARVRGRRKVHCSVSYASLPELTPPVMVLAAAAAGSGGAGDTEFCRVDGVFGAS